MLLLLSYWLFFTVLTVVMLAILLNVIIVAPYYSFIKRFRLYAKLKQYKSMMKEQRQPFDDLQKSEIKKQILALSPEKHSTLYKKWLTFSRKDYLRIFFLSLIIMAFKVHIYRTFVPRWTGMFNILEVLTGLKHILCCLCCCC